MTKTEALELIDAYEADPDKAAVAILRAAYTESDAGDTLYNARQYLQDPGKVPEAALANAE